MEFQGTRVKRREEGAERLLMNLESGSSPKTQRCASSHGCWTVGFGLILLHNKVCSAEGHYYQGVLNESTTALQAEGSFISIGELTLTWVALGSVQITSRLNSSQLFFSCFASWRICWVARSATRDNNLIKPFALILLYDEFYMLT